MDAEGLKNSRRGHRGTATRRIKEVEDEFLASPTPDPVRLDQLKRGLNDTFETLNDIQVQLLPKLDPGDVEGDIDEAERVKDRLFAAMARVDRALAHATPITPPAAFAPTTPPPLTTAKLPELTIKKFNGSLIGWSSFWESFKNSVHDNPSLSDARKFAYLQTFLEGKARDAIVGLSITDANYKVATKLLEDRFGDKEKTVDVHMERLMKLETVRSDNHVLELRRLYDRAESTIRSLEALGVALDSYGALLTPVFVSKLPPEFKLIVTRRVPKTEWNMKKILEVMQEELGARERVQSHDVRHNYTPKHNKENPTVGTFVSGSESGCCFCGDKGHGPNQCQSVTSVEDRKRIIRENGRCFNCLRKGHVGRDCRSSSKCNNCNGRHHTSICFKVKQDKPTDSNTAKPRNPTDNNSVKQRGLDHNAPPFKGPEPTHTCYSNNKDAILLQTAQAVAFNLDQPSRKLEAQILMDSGSQCSYITKRACRLLALRPIGTKSITIMTFGSREEQPTECDIVKLGIELRGGGCLELKLLSVTHICEPITNAPVDLESYPHLKPLEFATDLEKPCQFVPDVLLGSDQYWSLLTGEVIKGEQGPVALDSSIGWILSGPALVKGAVSQRTTLVTHVLRVDGVSEHRSLDKALHSFWNVESLGIIDKEDVMQAQFENNVSFEKGRYVVSLPWKEPCLALHNNYNLSLRRLKGLFRRMRSSPELLDKYDSVIQEQLNLGIVVPVNEHADCTNRIHYLPHHVVIRKDKSTTKVRVVYDASAKTEGPSLNDCLHIGPSLHWKILDILLRFRTYPVALVADIEKAFLMIQIAESDQDVLRFLWFKDVNVEVPEVQAFKFTRVVFGVSPSPYLLNATISQHLKQFEETHSTTVRKLKESMYVDDVISGAYSVEEAFRLCKEAKDIFRQGGFNLRKFNSNSQELLSKFREIENEQESVSSEESYARATLGSANSEAIGEYKVLGVKWDVSTDEFVIDIESIVEEALGTEPTKRNIVSVVCKIYDPMGIISPVVIQLKLFFQELCQSKITWDEPLGEVLRERWKRLLNGLRLMRVSRCLSLEFNEPMRLVGFCDASVKAYAALVYLQNGKKECSLIVSKTRVAPLPAQTIPRLELLGALLLARLIVNVREALSSIVSDYECFTDSLVVLHWIKGTDKNWKPFVQNRVQEIRASTASEYWSYCKGKNNPADLPSRGMTLLELAESRIWFQGPAWLRECDEDRDTGALLPPVQVLGELHVREREEGALLPPECLKELRAKDRELALFNAFEPREKGIGEIMNIERFSSFEKLIKSTAYVLLFVAMLVSLKEGTDNSSSNILEEYKQEAEYMWIRETQGGRIKPEWKLQFSLIVDDHGVWRCGGRLQNAELSFDTRHPIILPKDHPFTLLIVRRAHERVVHSGTKDTLTEIRSRYWIPQGRSLVQQFIHKCVLCRRFGASSYKAPLPPPLPEYRVRECLPFSSIGVDYAGPLTIRQNTHTSNNGVQNALSPCSGKAWVCLFTCCASRAVHFEIVTDLSPQSFIRCLKRFVSRRGLPSRIISDNGSTFKAAAKEIKKIMSHPSVQKYLSTVNISWRFNVERAPWWGGFFERMVQLLKRCLRKMVGQAKLDYEELYTAVTEVELILNSRPLTYVSATDLEEPLTPSHLIMGKRILSLPDHMCQPDDTDPDYL